MRTSRAGLDLIKHFEGVRLKPYLDARGLPTIGVGHLLTAEQAKKYSAGITQAQCDSLLKSDLLKAEAAINRMVKIPLNQGEFDALVSFVFNVGSGNFNASTLRMRLNRGDKAGAAAQFPRWRFSGGKAFNGLLRRRLAEQKLFKGG